MGRRAHSARSGPTIGTSPITKTRGAAATKYRAERSDSLTSQASPRPASADVPVAACAVSWRGDLYYFTKETTGLTLCHGRSPFTVPGSVGCRPRRRHRTRTTVLTILGAHDSAHRGPRGACDLTRLLFQLREDDFAADHGQHGFGPADLLLGHGEDVLREHR